MAPTLRKSTKDKSKASADTSSKAVRKRATVQKLASRNKRFPSTKKPVIGKKSKDLQHITDDNANSPLLLLPAEIRNMIFEFAARSPTKIQLYFNKLSNYSESGYSTQVHDSAKEHEAFALSQVCRQIYAETAVLIYRANEFSFMTYRGFQSWISKRSSSQLEAVQLLEILEGNDDMRERVFHRLNQMTCPSLISVGCDPETANQVWRERQLLARSDD